MYPRPYLTIERHEYLNFLWQSYYHAASAAEISKGDAIKMSNKSNKINVPEARAAMDRFKMESASEVGVNLKEGYNGDLTSRQAGSVGGQMVKKMIEAYENGLK
jgi:small acid-soluble spore protein D (minor alpha/beta-type SASP)